MKRKHKHQHAGGEVTELATETAKVEQYWIVGDRPQPRKPPKNYNYVEELINLQIEVIFFDGRRGNNLCRAEPRQQS
jgi:hypothetical protein